MTCRRWLIFVLAVSTQASASIVSIPEGYAEYDSVSRTSIQLALAPNLVANELIVVEGFVLAGASAASLTDNLGLSFHEVSCSPRSYSAGNILQVWWAQTGSSSGPDTLVMSWTGAVTFSSLSVVGYTGTDESSPVDVCGAAFGSSTAPSVVINTTSANEVLYGAIAAEVSGAVMTPGASFVLREYPRDAGGFGNGILTEDRVASASGAHAVGCNLSVSGPWGVIALGIVEAVDAGPGGLDGGAGDAGAVDAGGDEGTGDGGSHPSGPLMVGCSCTELPGFGFLPVAAAFVQLLTRRKRAPRASLRGSRCATCSPRRCR